MSDLAFLFEIVVVVFFYERSCATASQHLHTVSLLVMSHKVLTNHTHNVNASVLRSYEVTIYIFP